MPQLPRELPATAAAPAHHERRHNTDQRHREPLAMSPAPWPKGRGPAHSGTPEVNPTEFS